MKFMEAVQTTMGVGAAVGRGVDASGVDAKGTLLVSIRREAVRGRTIMGPNVHVWMRWCETHQVWFDGERCGLCVAEEEVGRE